MKQAIVLSAFAFLACGRAETGQPTTDTATKSAAEAEPEPQSSSPSTGEITTLVLKDLGSNAFGNLELEASCVVVSERATTADGTIVVAARVKVAPECSKSEYLWIYSRSADAGSWSDDYLGPPPRCWKGVPEKLADAVAKASGIAICE